MGTLPVSPVFNAPQRPCPIGNLRPATVAVDPLVERVLVEGNILAHFIRVDSASLLVEAIESITEVVDDKPGRQESSLQLPLKHLLIGLNQLLVFHIDFL